MGKVTTKIERMENIRKKNTKEKGKIGRWGLRGLSRGRGEGYGSGVTSGDDEIDHGRPQEL